MCQCYLLVLEHVPDHHIRLINPGPQRLVGEDSSIAYDDTRHTAHTVRKTKCTITLWCNITLRNESLNYSLFSLSVAKCMNQVTGQRKEVCKCFYSISNCSEFTICLMSLVLYVETHLLLRETPYDTAGSFYFK